MNPYSDLPDNRFWRRAVSGLGPTDVDPFSNPPFTISKTDMVASTGSCFAQHVTRELRTRGFRTLMTETGPEDRGFGVYPARFGNIYSPGQLLQLFERAYGLVDPCDRSWTLETGRFVDPFRPMVEPDGFDSIGTVETDRTAHLKAVRKMFERCDVLVFTMGLTEAWRNRQDGMILPLAPGVHGAPANPSAYEFHNFTVTEMTDQLTALIEKLRVVNPAVRVVLTVSPVPMIATYEDRHVLVSNTFSKSALRVVADQVCRQTTGVAYCPTYEVVTGQHMKHALLSEDGRSMSKDGVDHVMALFAKQFLSDHASVPEMARPTVPVVRLDPDGDPDEYDLICEEVEIDP